MNSITDLLDLEDSDIFISDIQVNGTRKQITCFLQDQIPYNCRGTSLKLQWEIPQSCIRHSRTLSGTGKCCCRHTFVDVYKYLMLVSSVPSARRCIYSACSQDC